MTRKIYVRPEAEVDLKDAFEWYERQREGLGSYFLLCVDETIAKIQREPELYPLVHKHVRRALMRRFPFGVFYLVDQETIILLAFFHGRRNPGEWKARV